jgi:hypothetical protein
MGDRGKKKKSRAQLVSEANQFVLSEHAAAKHKPQSRELPSIGTEYWKFVEETGGQFKIDGFPKILEEEMFLAPCRDFPISRFLPIIAKWQKYQKTGIRHWPIMAVLASRYQFLHRQQIGKQPSSKDISKLLSTIASSAEQLRLSLVTLQTLSSGTSDGSAAWAEFHLKLIDQFIAQAAAGIIEKDFYRVRKVLAAAQFGREQFIESLLRVEVAAKSAKNCLDVELFKRPTKLPENRPLLGLVMCAEIVWKSLTGRNPSVHKVHNEDREEPDFVIFVQELADIAGGPRPTFKQVQTAFRRPRPPV